MVSSWSVWIKNKWQSCTESHNKPWYYYKKHSTTANLLYFLPRTPPSCLPRTTSLQILVHYCHRFLSEKREGNLAHILTLTCRHKIDRYQTSALLHLSKISAINPLLLQSCIHHNIQHVPAQLHSPPLRPVMAILPYMLLETCTHDECCIKNNVTMIQTHHNKYLHHWLLNVSQTLVCVWREGEGAYYDKNLPVLWW